MPAGATIRSRGRLLAQFAAGQLGVQVLMVVGGLLLIRWMEVDAYALYTVAFGFSATLKLFVDLGITGSVVALLGERTADRALLGSYVRAALWQRERNFLVIAPLGAGLFLLVSADHGWTLESRLALAATIVAGLWVQGWIAAYTAPLTIHRAIPALYRPQTEGAAARLAGIGALQAGGVLTAVAANVLQLATTAWSGRAIRRAGRSQLTEPTEVSREHLAELRSYLRPLWPSMAFYAIQGQLLVLLASVFAATRTIAEVGALSRLAQLLTFFLVLNSVLIAPAIARTPRDQLARRFVLFALAGTVGTAAVTLLAFVWREPFLLLLGGTYEDLDGTAVGLALAGGCLVYLESLIWTMNSARKWVWGWHTALYIGLALASQITAVLVVDLTTTTGLLLVGVWVNATILAVQLVATVYGFSSTRRTS